MFGTLPPERQNQVVAACLWLFLTQIWGMGLFSLSKQVLILRQDEQKG